MSKRIEIEGKRFARWKVNTFVENKNNHSMYLCICDCGKTKVVSGSYLRNGKSKSCGCINIEKIKSRKIPYRL